MKNIPFPSNTGVALLVLSAVTFSSVGIFTKGVSADAWSVIFWRGLSGAIFSLIFLAGRSKVRDELLRFKFPAVLAALLGASGTAAFIPAFKLTSVANVSLILRTYGTARVIHPRDAEWDRLYALFPDFAGARNIYVLDLDLVTTSCGSGVPEMSLERSRAETDMVPWYADMGVEGVTAFWAKKNTLSLDGFETGIFETPKE